MPTKKKPYEGFMTKFLALLITSVMIVSAAGPAFSQVRISGAGGVKAVSNKKSAKQNSRKNARGNDKRADDSDEIIPDRLAAQAIAMKTTAEIMDEQAARGIYTSTRELLRESGVKRKKKVRPDRRALPDGPGQTFDANRYPITAGDEGALFGAAPEVAAQTTGPSFLAVNGPSETGAFPPDTEAEVGPNGVVVHLNGRLRTFNKGTSVDAPTA